jgi:hypothetical protein
MDAPTEDRLQTRMTNKEQHPGQVTYTASGRARRQTKDEMEAYRREQEAKKGKPKQTRTQSSCELHSWKVTWQSKIRNQAMLTLEVRKVMCYFCCCATLWDLKLLIDTNMCIEEDRDSGHAVNIPSDGSVPPQMKKTVKKGVSVKPAPKPRGKRQVQRRKGIFILIIC